LILESQVAVYDRLVVSAFFCRYVCSAPQPMFCLPENVAFRVEQLLGRAQMIGDDGVEDGGGVIALGSCTSLLGNGIECAWSKCQRVVSSGESSSFGLLRHSSVRVTPYQR